MKQLISIFMLVPIMSLVSCQGFIIQKHPSITPTTSPTSIPTEVPDRTLTICLGEEPQSLYLYAEDQSDAMWSVLEAIYDGPVDQSNDGERAVILQKIPSLEDGDLTSSIVQVEEGDLLVNAESELVALETGTHYLPTGCRDDTCEVAWDGVSEVRMDQMAATFKLRSNILWSDGIPLTSEDSRFSYEIAGDPSTMTDKNNFNLTASYEVIDEAAIHWVGVPGFQSIVITDFFWSPLPKHILGDISVPQLAASELASHQPLGWGPYMLKKWNPGENIELINNPNYFRADEGLPRFDRLVYRFMNPSSGGSIQALTLGLCDLVERSSTPLADISLIVNEVANNNQIILKWDTGPELTQLAIGINPSSYDDGYNAAIDRPDYFSDSSMRQALAICINRQRIVEEVFDNMAGLGSIDTLLGKSVDGNGLPMLDYDPVGGGQQFEQAGWVDLDNDWNTPRTAVNVSGIPAGTSLSLTLLTPDDSISTKVATIISDSLSACGIVVIVKAAPFEELFAPGPDGSVFGRAFDLVLLTWQVSHVPACNLYTTSQIPGVDNYWVGGNVTGYTNPDFDVACNRLLHAQTGTDDYEFIQQEVIEIFTADIPAIPLFSLPKAVLTRSDFCAFEFKPSYRSDLTELELFDFGQHCLPG